MFHGASPALTVRSGSVALVGGVTLANSTAAPTVVVHDGALNLRGVRVEESNVSEQPAIEILGGWLIWDRVFDPGDNTINVDGDGQLIRNLSSNPVTAVGNEWKTDDVRMHGFETEDAIMHALDENGRGLVTLDPRVLFVTPDSGSVQRAVNNVEGTRQSVVFGLDTTIVVEAGVSMTFDAEDRLLGVVFEDGPFIHTEMDFDDPKKTILEIEGTSDDDSISS